MTFKMRFKYDGTWTRWFNEGENLSELKNINIEMVEIIERMTYAEFLKQYDLDLTK